MAESDVEGALFVAANTFLAAQSITGIAWPNRDFDPAGFAKWALVNYIPADITVASAGSNGLDREVGFMQVDLNVPRNTGDSVLRALRDAARAYFITGRTFTQNSQSVRITGCVASPARRLDNWLRLTITISYRAEFQRATIS